MTDTIQAVALRLLQTREALGKTTQEVEMCIRDRITQGGICGGQVCRDRIINHHGQALPPDRLQDVIPLGFILCF